MAQWITRLSKWMRRPRTRGPLAEKHPTRQTKQCMYPGSADAPYQCKCHEHMQNDFWFLPSDRCLWDSK